MTLNITILSPAGIHQSADFKISETERDSAGRWITLLENASKIVTLHYRGWTGSVTYCGIGLWRGKRTDEFLAEWLADMPLGATFHGVLERLRERGSSWSGEINRALEERKPHSFILTGFEDGVARYAIVSNYESLSGAASRVSDALQVDAGSTAHVHVLITGIRDAVSEEDRRLLARLAETERDFGVLAHHMAEVNTRAAATKAAQGGISSACLTASSDPTGAQWSRVYGDVQGPVIPSSVFGGAQIDKVLKELLRNNPQAKVVQSASISSVAHQAATAEKLDCALRFRSGFADSQRDPIASVEETGALNEYCLDMRSVNDVGCIVGNVRNVPDNTPHAFFWPPHGKIQDLGTLGGPHGYAHDINIRNEVVGGAHVNASDMHAFVWTEEGGMHDLGTLGGKSSVAFCINDRLCIVGQSQRQGDTREHAFFCSPETGMVDLFPEFDGFSRAMAVTTGGIIAGWAGRGDQAEFGWVLYPDKTYKELRTPEGRPFFVVGINESGLVVGEADDRSGRRRPLLWTQDGGVELGTVEPFHPMDVDLRGNVVGWVHGGRHPLGRPFIWLAAAGELLPLPFPEEHQVEPVAINGQGQIVGAARGRTWKHLHPLIWRLKI